MSGNTFDNDVHFEIVERIGVISSYSTGWNKELNLVSWNGGPPKYDIRDWAPDYEHMSRGVTLHEKEMRQVLDLLKKRARKYARGNTDNEGVDSEYSQESGDDHIARSEDKSHDVTE